MGGEQAAGELLALDPEARIIVSSGYANDPIMAQYRELGFSGVMAKPYDLTAMGQVLQRVIDDRTD